MPINYTLYPDNWFTEIRPAILIRANWRCEKCQVPSGAIGYRDHNKVFIECDKFMLEWCEKTNQKTFKIVLTIAHLDHDITNNNPENLKAWCQKCHLNYDQEKHIFQRKINRELRRKEERNPNGK